ncbi:hypothetical protein ABAC460_01655 [Asticcacaulis sp. AC460]|uniref:HAAS signaling domain-containing protein n=1 Tax=Asticcacaulis sp. AC460 TaxID=1282360 RepID=UPI0003C3D7DB|nr:hypothetical protein [Asticcacaulis sp. AC460]ESQ92982.1 hypothetical protein ABAC460_01655 [Asticcacaulis sp. AC460]
MLEDYLRAVSRLLPRSKRDDIIAELRDEILTRIEAKEAELGRVLTDAETEQLLRDFGHPIVVAARYRDGPQYGVGPALYPYWAFAVRFAVIIQVCVSVIVFAARILSGGDIAEAFGSAIGSGVTGAMTLIGFATVAAWLVERKGIKVDYLNAWRVQDLRFLDFAFWDWTDVQEWMAQMNSSKHGTMTAGFDFSDDFRAIGRSTTGRGIGTIVGGVVLLLWWVGLLRFGFSSISFDFGTLGLDPGALAQVDWPAFKAEVFGPFVAYFAALITYGMVVLVHPAGVRLRGAIDIVIGVMAIAISAWIGMSSSIAPVVGVDSVAELIERTLAMAAHPVPVPLTTVVTLILTFTAIGGFFRALRGLWAVVVGAYAERYRLAGQSA